MTHLSESGLVEQFLAVNDAPCPYCGYNLRSCTRPECPECGQALTLGLGGPGSPGGRRLLLLMVLLFLLGASALDGVREGLAIHRVATISSRQMLFVSNLLTATATATPSRPDRPVDSATRAATDANVPAAAIEDIEIAVIGVDPARPRIRVLTAPPAPAAGWSQVGWTAWASLGLSIAIGLAAGTGLVMLLLYRHTAAPARVATLLRALALGGLSVCLAQDAIGLVGLLVSIIGAPFPQ